MRDFIIGTAGHIDHGKTTLLKAVTGIDTDRLKEERQRGISIDIGFAHVEVDGKRIGFVDVPGHERFVKNMLSGIGGIQFVLLLVAADESVMPQTIEHLEICRLLEIPAGITVISKADLVDSEMLELVREEIRDLTNGTFLQDSPVIEVDSVSGRGVDRLLAVITSELERLPYYHSHQPDEMIFRMPIDRVFSLPGHGTIVTGTPGSGQVRKGESLTAMPPGRPGKVRGIEVFGERVDLANAGQRTALNLSGVDRRELRRGMVLAEPDTIPATQILNIALHILERAPAPLKHGAPVRFHHGSGEFLARIHLMGRSEVEPGSSTVAQIRLSEPTLACALDHFILRRYSPMTTIGGGIVLDSLSSKQKPRSNKQLVGQLELLLDSWRSGTGPTVADLMLFYIAKSRAEGMDYGRLAAHTGIRLEALRRIVSSLPGVVTVPQDPPLCVMQAELERLEARICRFLDNYHQLKPLAAGASQEELKNRFLAKARPAYFQYLLERMAGAQLISINSGIVCAFGHKVQLTEEQEELKRRILERFEPRKLQPPTLGELRKLHPDSSQVDRVFFYLLQSGELVRINDEIVLTSGQLNWLRQTVRSHFAPGQPFEVGEFKDLFGLSRKFAIPFLEFLDRERFTRRVADRRIVL